MILQMKQKRKKSITLDDLARMVQVGFAVAASKTKERFDEVDEQFDAVNKQFDEMKEESRLVNGRLDSIETELIDIKKKLDNIIYRHEFEILKDRIRELEKKVGIKAS